MFLPFTRGARAVYAGDIGDNDAERDRITGYRSSEPAAATGSAQVSDVFHADTPMALTPGSLITFGLQRCIQRTARAEFA